MNAQEPPTLGYGKDTRDVLLVALGQPLMRALDRRNNKPNSSLTADTTPDDETMDTRHGRGSEEWKVSDDELDLGEEEGGARSAPLDSDNRLLNKTEDEMLDYLCGTDTTGGQLLVSQLSFAHFVHSLRSRPSGS